MHYIIQKGFFQAANLRRITETLDRLAMSYEVLVPQREGGFEIETDRKDVFCFGALRMTELAKAQAWQPGSLFNDQHDYLVCAAHWGAGMLNSDSSVQPLLQRIDFSGGQRFVRPTKDSKLFSGGLFDQGTWSATLERAKSSELSEGALIQVAAPKQIYQEIRCWMIDGKVVTASTYQTGGAARWAEYTDAAGIDFAESMARLFQPAEAFVLDICLSDQGWKVVEVNCINSAGFYACDLQRLVIALEQRFGT